MRVRRLGGRAVVGVVLAIFTLFFGVPLLWLLIAATQNPGASSGWLTPGSWTDLVANWNSLIGFEGGAFIGWLGNSTLYTFSALIIAVIVSVPAGYALAMTSFRFRKTLLIATLIVMLIPNTALVLPIFLELNAVHLIGSPLSVILPFSFFPFGVYLTFIYFTTSVSRELLAAARLDGCSEFEVFTRIALPLASPAIALIAFFSFTQNWNNYFLPFVMLPNNNEYTVQIGLTIMHGADLPMATLVSVLPVALVFLVSQRYLVTGLSAGSLRG